MSDIKLETISAPELGSPSYGANIEKQFENINSNFTQIVEGEYLKGQSGDLVMLEEIDLTSTENQNYEIRKAFDAFIKGLQVGDNGIGNEEGDINSSKLYMIYTLNQETGDKIYKTSLPYTFLDPRFNPLTNKEKDNESMDKSCIIMYDGEGFVSYNAFPNIYFNQEQNEFCWKINGLETQLPARGARGETGYAGSFYMLKAQKGSIEENYHKVSFLIQPNNHPEVNVGDVIKGDIVDELEGQCAFVYHESGGYLTTIERTTESGEVYAKCNLDPSLNVYNIFSGSSLFDVLKGNMIDENGGYGSLFLPIERKGDKRIDAHILTTRLERDQIGYGSKEKNVMCLVLSPGMLVKDADGRLGWSRSVGNLLGYEFINNYEVSKFPHKTFFNEVTIGEHIEGDTPSVSGNLTVFDKMTVGCKSTYKDEVTGEKIPYNFGELWVGSTINIGDNTGVLRTGEIQIGEIPWIFSTQRTPEHISILTLSAQLPPDLNQTQLFKIDSIVEIPRISSTAIDSLHASSASIDSLHVKSVWPSQQSLYIPYKEVTDPDASLPETFVYLTWGDFGVEIPHDTSNNNYSNAEHKYLSLGDSQYLLYPGKLNSSYKTYVPSTLNLTFDLSKSIPYTVIDVTCDSPLKSISFANGDDVKIYCSGFGGWSTDKNIEIITVQSGRVKTINFDLAPKLDDDENPVIDENGELIFESMVYDKIILSPISGDKSQGDHTMNYMLSIESRTADSFDRFISNIAESKWTSMINTDVKKAVAANTLSLKQFDDIAKSINLPQASTFSLRSTPVQTEEEHLDSNQIRDNFIAALNGRLDPDALADSLQQSGKFALADSTAILNTDVETLKTTVGDLRGYNEKIFDENGEFKSSIIKELFVKDEYYNSPIEIVEGTNKLKFNPQILYDDKDFKSMISENVSLQIPTIDTSNFVKQGDLTAYMSKAELGINGVTSFKDVVKGVVGIKDGETFEDKVLGTLGVKPAESFETVIRNAIGLDIGESLNDRISDVAPTIDESKFLTISTFESEKAELNNQIQAIKPDKYPDMDQILTNFNLNLIGKKPGKSPNLIQFSSQTGAIRKYSVIENTINISLPSEDVLYEYLYLPQMETFDYIITPSTFSLVQMSDDKYEQIYPLGAQPEKTETTSPISIQVSIKPKGQLAFEENRNIRVKITTT